VDVGGVRTHYLEAGEGPTVVLLHSGEFGGAAELSWERNIGALAAQYRVVAPDWLGYGRTDKVHDFGGGRARMLDHLRRFLDVMAIDEADFVGNSMGGTLLVGVAATQPVAWPIRSVVLCSGGGFTPENDARRALLSYDCTPESMRTLLRAMFHDPSFAGDDAYVARRQELALLPGAWECTAAARFKSPAAPVRSGFGQADETPYEAISVPTLVIAGADDQLREPGYADELGRRIPDAEVHVLDACGHCPNIEQAEAFNGLVLDFLARVHERPQQ
jgi:pimeloyl-ACP methyl ester carboxylesterase